MVASYFPNPLRAALIASFSMPLLPAMMMAMPPPSPLRLRVIAGPRGRTWGELATLVEQEVIGGFA